MNKNRKKRISIITIFYLAIVCIVFSYMGNSLYKAVLRGQKTNLESSKFDEILSKTSNSTLVDNEIKLNEVEELNYDKDSNYQFYLNYSDSKTNLNIDNEIKLLEVTANDVTTQNNGSSGDFWEDGSTWYKNMVTENKNDTTIGNSGMDSVIKVFVDMINVVGTTLIALATIFLGVKYMFGSVDNKVSVKESLPSLLVACVFFFGWSSIRGLLISADNEFILFSDTSSYTTILGDIFSLFTYLANGLSILAVVYIGIRYIISGAPGRADLKAKSPQFILGVIMAFCASSFLAFVSTVINDII